MYLSLNWLKEFVKIPKAITPEELAKRLTLHTVEVEKVEYQAGKHNKVVVGKILEVKPHPNADRLRLALVDTGREKLEIVCGAPNIKAGQFVPVALVGARLPNGLEIKPAEIRGIKSNGMLCAEDELGLGKDHDGIMLLDKAPVGQNFSDYLKLNDVIFEVDNKSITHRADLWSHYGMARDISAFLNCEFNEYKVNIANKPPLSASWRKGGRGDFKVEVKDFKLCPRYMAIGLEGIKIAPSPKWLSDRLLACGLRPINNIVDVTNYVMLELGQPLHAFDKNFIDQIIVRRAYSGETIKTLDGQTRKLEPDMLLIANQDKPVAIAGVMGGADSEISGQTTSIIIEAANFNFASVRQTAQKLGLRTEASSRFEKGLDPNLCGFGLARAAELIFKICPGAKAAGQKKYKLTPLNPYGRQSLFNGVKQDPVKLDLAWLNQFIGHEFKPKQVRQILEKLGFAVKTLNKSLFSVIIPSWRSARDVSLKEDLAEEVARIYGYNKLKPVMPKADLTPPAANDYKMLARKVKNILSVGAGLAEVYNYSFTGADVLNKLKIDRSLAIKLANPLSEDLAFLRPSLAPGLLKNIKANQAAEAEIGIYEIGDIFLNRPGDIKKDNKGRETLFWQEKNLAIILAGEETADMFRRLKGIIEYLLSALNLTVMFLPAQAGESAAALPVWAENSTAADILVYPVKSGFAGARPVKYVAHPEGISQDKQFDGVNGKIIGQVAALEKNISRAFGLKKTAALAEINFKSLSRLTQNQPVKQFKEPLKYPEVLRDLALVSNEKILYNNIKKQIINFSNLIRQVELFDVYYGENIGQGKKSLAFHIIYQADRTLTSEEVDKVQAGLVKHLEKELGAKIRNF